MEVLKLCVVQGVQVCKFGVPIFDEEIVHWRGSSEAVHEQ